MEGSLQLSHENVQKSIFGQVTRFFGALVVNHHFLLPAQLHLREREEVSTGKEEEHAGVWVLEKKIDLAMYRVSCIDSKC